MTPLPTPGPPYGIVPQERESGSGLAAGKLSWRKAGEHVLQISAQGVLQRVDARRFRATALFSESTP